MKRGNAPHVEFPVEYRVIIIYLFNNKHKLIISGASQVSTMTRVTNFGRKRTFVEAGFSNKGGASPIKEEHTTELNRQVEEKPKKSNSKAHKKLLKLKAKKAAAKGKGKQQLRVKNSDTSPSLNHTSAGTQSPKSWRASLPLSEQRRQKRIAERAAETICFMCREKGHAAKDCPTSPTTLDDGDTTRKIGICYRCGSSKHILSRCSKPTDHTNPLPFASCFVCFARGHLAGSCPDNKERGVYPNGGSCKICGDVGHLARECGVRSKGTYLNLNYSVCHLILMLVSCERNSKRSPPVRSFFNNSGYRGCGRR